MQPPVRRSLPAAGLVCRWRHWGVLLYTDRALRGEPPYAAFSYLGQSLPHDWRGRTLGGRWADVKKPLVGVEETVTKCHADVPESLAVLLPNVCAMLCDGVYEDGTPKGPGSIFLEPYMGRWHLRAKIRGSGLMITLGASDPEAAMVALEAALASETPPWEHDPFGGVSGKRKKK
jgi:hypothetical protein